MLKSAKVCLAQLTAVGGRPALGGSQARLRPLPASGRRSEVLPVPTVPIIEGLASRVLAMEKEPHGPRRVMPVVRHSCFDIVASRR